MQRTVYIDIAKCFAIWLVLWGHAITQLMPHDLSQNRVYVMIYSFHMPLFMLMSGLFAKKAMSAGILELAKKKFLQLIVPSLTFGILWYLIEHIAYGGWSLTGFVKHEVTCYWFLKSLFLCFLVTRICYCCGKWRMMIMVVILLSFLFMQQWDITCFKLGNMLPFFWCGIWLNGRLLWMENNWKYIACCSLILFAGLLSQYDLSYSFANYFFHDFDYMALLRYCYYALTALVGSVMVLSFSKGFQNYKLLTKFGTQTLGIYLWQKLLLEELMPLIFHVEMPLPVYNFLFTTTVSVVMLVVCYCAVQLSNKNRLLRLVLFLEKK